MRNRNTLWAAALLGLTALGNAQDRKEAARPIEFDAEKAEIVLRGQPRSLADVLHELQRDHGIVVTVQDFQDRMVKVDLGRRPLLEALRELLGPDARYRLEVRGVELTLPAPTDGQVEARKPQVRSERPLMDTKQLGPRPGAPIMPEPTSLVTPQGMAGEMMASGQIPAMLSDAEAARQVLTAAQKADQTHACVILRMRRDGSSVVERIVELDGPALRNSYLHGSCLYSVHVGDDMVAVGAMQDPLQVYPICSDRPADPRLRPTRTEDDEALVTLPLDKRFLNNETLSRAVIRFFRLTDGADLPVELTTETFAAFRAKSVALGSVDARALTSTRIERR